MGKKIKMTWAELRRQRTSLERFEHYLPILQLKQQQLQSVILQTRREQDAVKQAADDVRERIAAYGAVLNDTAGINLAFLSEPEDVKTIITNVAGVKVPVFESAGFPQHVYSLFSTPPWVDRALSDQREKSLTRVKLEIVEQKLDLLQAELKKVMQRVNLFEKVIIPEAQENIRRIRIGLGDQMTAAVARAKIAKEKILERRRRDKMEAGQG